MDAVVAPRTRLGLPRRALRVAPDERLVAQVRAGSRSAFEALYDRHHGGILAFCRHMLGSREEAEDALQHTFIAAYQALLADDREIALKPWLYAIARNRCLSILRVRREHVALDDVAGVLPATAGLAAEVERRDDLRALLADLQALPEDQRAALVLAELGSHSHHEIAQVLGVRTAKVKALVFQAREGLMIRRQARETGCGEIREQLATLRGGALRRAPLRRHLQGCDGCRAFAAEVRRQRAGMAVLLPVAPTLALKHTSLAAAFGAASSGAAATAVGTTAAGGAAALGVKAVATKALAVLAVAGGAGGGGYVAVDELRSDPPAAPAKVAPAAPAAQPAQPVRAAPAVSATTPKSGATGDRGVARGPVERPRGESGPVRRGPSERAADRARGPGERGATPGSRGRGPQRRGATAQPGTKGARTNPRRPDPAAPGRPSGRPGRATTPPQPRVPPGRVQGAPAPDRSPRPEPAPAKPGAVLATPEGAGAKPLTDAP